MPLKKMLSILFAILIIGCFITSLGLRNDKSEVYRNMVNSDFAIALDQSNSTVEFVHSLLSRDSIYVICFNLIDEYSTLLSDKNIFGNENKYLLMKQYVEPYIHVIDGLDAMSRDSETEHCYVALKIKEYSEFSKSFSLLLLNSAKNKLYWFLYST